MKTENFSQQVTISLNNNSYQVDRICHIYGSGKEIPDTIKETYYRDYPNSLTDPEEAFMRLLDCVRSLDLEDITSEI